MRAILVVVVASALWSCAIDAQSVGEFDQGVVSGVVTMILPPSAFVPTPFGIQETGPIVVTPGTLWLSASIAIHCQFPGEDMAQACVRSVNPASPSYAATVWCGPVTTCNADMIMPVAFTAFAADETHALALHELRTSGGAAIVNATVTMFAFGP